MSAGCGPNSRESDVDGLVMLVLVWGAVLRLPNSMRAGICVDFSRKAIRRLKFKCVHVRRSQHHHSLITGVKLYLSFKKLQSIIPTLT